MLLRLILLLLLCYTQHTLAASKPSYWECTAHDDTKQQWTAKNPYRLLANNHALDACKKQSHHPTSCVSLTKDCHYSDHHELPLKKLNSLTESSGWQCTALDRNANVWHNHTHPQQEAAALEAKSSCQRNSRIPDTCYVNLITCVRLESALH